jgi:hypothetical protein
MQVLKLVSDESLDFFGVCSYLPFCVCDFTNLGLIPSHFSQIYQGLVNLVLFHQFFVVFFFFALYFINFGPSFYYFPTSACFGFCIFLCSRRLRCGIRSFIWDLYVILIYTLMTINFPLRTAFALSHRFF